MPVGKGRLKERCGLEARTNFFSFKKVAKTRCRLDSRIYGNSLQFQLQSSKTTKKTRDWGVWILLPISAVGWSISGYGKGMLGVLKGCGVWRMARLKVLGKG
jgi:hypothetical protein